MGLSRILWMRTNVRMVTTAMKTANNAVFMRASVPLYVTPLCDILPQTAGAWRGWHEAGSVPHLAPGRFWKKQRRLAPVAEKKRLRWGKQEVGAMSWLRSIGDDRDRANLERVLERGICGGLVASAAMGLFAMVASATYQGRGFFTPMYHAAFIIDENTMGEAIAKAGAGEPFYFLRETFIFGLVAYVFVGGVFGAVFSGIARRLRPRGPMALLCGVGYGLAVMLVMSYLVLPPAASLFGTGDPIARMGSEVGWPTFVATFAIFGLTLGSWVYLRPEDVGMTKAGTRADPSVAS